MPDAQSDSARMANRRMALSREWDDLVGQVRQLNGFEDFLRPPRLGTLLPAAKDGPVAVINISRWRCDAVIVTTTGVRVVELPRLSVVNVAQNASDYLRVLDRVDATAGELRSARERYDGGDRGLDAISRYTEAKRAVQDAERDRDQTLASVLAWLWDVIADPVLSALGLLAWPGSGQASPGRGCGGARRGCSRCCPCTRPGITTPGASRQEAVSLTGWCRPTHPACVPWWKPGDR